MSDLAHSTSSIQTTRTFGQGTIRDESQRSHSPHAAPIHVLDDDSLLDIFYLYRPAIFDVNEGNDDYFLGERQWDREQWLYKLAQVCQRWREIILASSSYLGLYLFCTRGTPVADMLAHSLPLPLVLDYSGDITAEDENGIILALKEHDRVRRVRLELPVLQLQNLILMVPIDEEYPVLEYLIILPSTSDRSGTLMLPETLQAPHLRYLALKGVALPIGSRLLTTALSLVTLCLSMDYQSIYYFMPSTLLQWISFMPQLETLVIIADFSSPVVRQLMPTLIATQVTLPNLRLLEFRGFSAYLEAVVCQIATPYLQKLVTHFPSTVSVPRLLEFMNSTENLRFHSAKFVFSWDEVYVEASPPEAEMYSLSMHVHCEDLDEQARSMAQIFNSPSQILSTVQHLTFKHNVQYSLSEGDDNVGHTLWHRLNRLFKNDHPEWRQLVRLFSNLKTLHVDDELVQEFSCGLRLDEGEHPLALLPELHKLTVLTYSGDCDTGDAFTYFIDTRKKAGRPVTLVHSGPEIVTPLS